MRKRGRTSVCVMGVNGVIMRFVVIMFFFNDTATTEIYTE